MERLAKQPGSKMVRSLLDSKKTWAMCGRRPSEARRPISAFADNRGSVTFEMMRRTNPTDEVLGVR